MVIWKQLLGHRELPPIDGDIERQRYIERDEDRYRYGDTATKSCRYSYKKI